DPEIRCKVRIIQSYIKISQEDELKVLQNDVVAVSKNNFDEDPNDWLYGTNLRTKQKGFFPTQVCDIKFPNYGNLFYPRKATAGKKISNFKISFNADAAKLDESYWMEAVKSYTHVYNDEHDIKVRDLIWVTYQSSNDFGWFYGKKNGIGPDKIFPVSYLNRVDYPVFNVVKEYKSKSLDELSLHEGDKIESLRKSLMLQPNVIEKTTSSHTIEPTSNEALHITNENVKFWKVVVEYVPEFDDEMKLNIDDVIEIGSPTADETWYKGKKVGNNDKEKVFCTDYCNPVSNLTTTQDIDPIKEEISPVSSSNISGTNELQIKKNASEENDSYRSLLDLESQKILEPSTCELKKLEKSLNSIEDDFKFRYESIKQEFEKLKKTVEDTKSNQNSSEIMMKKIDDSNKKNYKVLEDKIASLDKSFKKEIEILKMSTKSSNFFINEDEWQNLNKDFKQQESLNKEQNGALINLTELNDKRDSFYKEHIQKISRRLASLEGKVGKIISSNN
ncbi:MAG: hypothetical protein MHPSP_000477, partial [Paramarteilia canceri]